MMAVGFSAVFRVAQVGFSSLGSRGSSVLTWNFASLRLSTSADDVVRPFEELPKKPKKPTLYMEFHAVNYPKVKEAQPNLSAIEISKVLGGMWRKINPTERKKYDKVYRDKQADYRHAMEYWKANLNEAEMKIVANLDRAKREKIKEARAARAKRQERKSVREESWARGKPKKPLVPYLSFSHSRLPSRPRGEAVTEFFRRCSEEFKRLPPRERDSYQVTFEIERKKYKDSLEEWNRRMVDEGHVHLVSPGWLKASKRKPDNKAIQDD